MDRPPPGPPGPVRGGTPPTAAPRPGGIEPNVVFRSDDNGTVQSFVAAGLGSALMRRLAVDAGDPRVTVIAVDELPPRRIGVAWHRDRYRSPAFDAFLQLAEVAELAQV